MSPEEYITKKILELIPDAQIKIRDLTGTRDHWEVTVISSQFAGKSMLQQHRWVTGLFEADIASNALHAFSLKTYTPEEWSRKNSPQ
jgi:stress-induced morphogen